MTTITIPVGSELLAMSDAAFEAHVVGRITEELQIELAREQAERERVFLHGARAEFVVMDELPVDWITPLIHDIARCAVDKAVVQIRAQDAKRRRIPGLDHTGKGGKRKNKWSRWHG